MNTFSHYGLLFLSNILTWLLWPTLMSTLKSLCSWYIYTIRHVCHCPRTQGKVNKSVRRPVAGVCLLLAAKFVLDLKRKEISDLIEVSLLSSSCNLLLYLSPLSVCRRLQTISGCLLASCSSTNSQCWPSSSFLSSLPITRPDSTMKNCSTRQLNTHRTYLPPFVRFSNLSFSLPPCLVQSLASLRMSQMILTYGKLASVAWFQRSLQGRLNFPEQNLNLDWV